MVSMTRSPQLQPLQADCDVGQISIPSFFPGSNPFPLLIYIFLRQALTTLSRLASVLLPRTVCDPQCWDNPHHSRLHLTYHGHQC